MKYFTRSLYERIQVGGATAVRALKMWEHNDKGYKKHLINVVKELPPCAAGLSKVLLHDALVVAVEKIAIAAKSRWIVSGLTWKVGMMRPR